jgi:hypothetical protein
MVGACTGNAVVESFILPLGKRSRTVSGWATRQVFRLAVTQM